MALGAGFVGPRAQSKKEKKRVKSDTSERELKSLLVSEKKKKGYERTWGKIGEGFVAGEGKRGGATIPSREDQSSSIGWRNTRRN